MKQSLCSILNSILPVILRGHYDELSRAIDDIKTSFITLYEDAIRFSTQAIVDLKNFIIFLESSFPGLTQLITIITSVGALFGTFVLAIVALKVALAAAGIGLGA